MKKRSKIAAISLATVLTAGSFMITANAASAGSSGDPLVTKSYVDSVVANLFEMLSDDDSSSMPSSTQASFEPVKVEKGEILIGGEGAEIILRSGTAVSYTESADGLIDITLGKEFYNGTDLVNNHLLIVSRDDGRGAKVTSEEAWFIVKGGYSIK